MLSRLLSHDLPRNKLLALILIAIVLGLAFAPFLFPGVKALNVAAKVLIFVVLVAAFDLLLGYTGIVSFAHTMFFGIGAYGIAIASSRMGASWSALAVGVGGALVLSLLLSLAIGLFSLRVRAIFFAMITLAVAAAFQTLASQLSEWTGGEDGLTFRLPEVLSPSFEPFETEFLGVLIDGKIITYYLLFVVAVVLVLALLRIVNSPFGRVLQAIRENEFRAEAIGYRVVVYRTTSSVLSALFATLAGAMLALWLRYNGPDTSLSFEIMMDCLLIVVIGGMGTIYGSAIGAVLSPAFEWVEEPFLGVSLDGRLLCYYLLFVLTVVLLAALLRIVNSPFGRVLQAIRENEFRAEAIGYRVVVYRTTSSVLSALFATLAGAMLALWLRYNGPDTSLSFEIMMDCLLIVVIGGMGTIYGSVIGAVLFVVAQSYLQDLLRLGHEATTGLPWLSALLSPDRWLLWLGVLFVLSVYYFPSGVVGRMRAAAAVHRAP